MEPPPPTRISDVGVRALEKKLDVSLHRLSCRALRIWRSDLHIRQRHQPAAPAPLVELAAELRAEGRLGPSVPQKLAAEQRSERQRKGRPEPHASQPLRISQLPRTPREGSC